jgi:fructose-1,6-bisphosphatase
VIYGPQTKLILAINGSVDVSFWTDVLGDSCCSIAA